MAIRVNDRIHLSEFQPSDEAASAKVLEKCGFQQEGLLRKHYFKDGKNLDAKLFALLQTRYGPNVDEHG